MNCPNCGSVMVDESPGQWCWSYRTMSKVAVMICNCGHRQSVHYVDKSKPWQERWKEANEKSYYGMKATLSDGIVTFEDGQKFDLSQPIKEANEVKDG